MSKMYALILAAGLFLLACFIIIVYYLYINMVRRQSMTRMFEQKEQEILELYNSLEKMMDEMDMFIYQSKLEMEEEKNTLLKLYKKTEFDGVEKSLSQAVIPVVEEKPETVQTEKENLLKKFSESKNDKGKRVFMLYRQGVSTQNIAKMLGLGNGEVQLLINLNNKNENK